MTSQYVFADTDDREVDRLRALQGLLDRGTRQLLTDLPVRRNGRCLEVGAGAGSVATWLGTHVVPDGLVVATDIDTRFLERLDLGANVEVRHHDVTVDPIESATFDLIHARYVLEHIRGWEAVIGRLVAALRPGGWLVLETSDPLTAFLGLSDTGPVGALRLAFDRVFEQSGSDSTLGRRLAGVFAGHGLREIGGEARSQLVPGWSSQQAQAYRLSLQELLPRIVGLELMSDHECHLALDALASADPAFFNHLTIACWGRR